MRRKVNLVVIVAMLVALGGVGAASIVSAGPLDPSAGPANTSSYTLEQLWNRLTTGAVATPVPFTEPAAGPGTGTMHTLDEIMAVAPAVNANGASAAEVASGKAFWGLASGSWGMQTGAAPLGGNVSGGDGALTFNIPNGFYTGKTATAQDADLVAGNIRTGVNLFGVVGTAIQASGNAAAGEVLNGRTFSNASGGATGTMPNNGAVVITPAATPQVIAAGYHNGTGSVAGDTDLAAANIKSGVNIFGVAGSVVESTGNAVVGEVLATKTFSKAGAANLTGTMPNNGAVSITPGTTSQAIAAGYHNGSGSVAGDADLAAANIKSGVNIFGVAGSVVEATGDAVVGEVLTGKVFSKAGAANLTGTMPNRGAVVITPSATDQAIAAGYHNGTGKVVGDADLVAGNIKNGVDLFGVVGTSIQASGNAAAGEVLNGRTFSNASGGATGTMPNNGAVVIMPAATPQAIPAGYHNGTGSVVGDTDLAAANIKTGVSIFGVAGSVVESTGNAVAGDVLATKTFSKAGAANLTGTMPNNGAVVITPAATPQAIPAGYHNGTGSVVGDTDLAAANIKSGVSIFGVAGSVVESTGNAVAGDVLATKTFSKAGAANLTGTMPNNGAVVITPAATAQPIPAGYHNGTGSVVGDTNLAAANIKTGVSIFGVAGSVIQSTGNAAAGDVLTGHTFSNVNAAGVTGTMPNNGAVVLTPAATPQAIPAGYHNGTGSVVGDTDLAAGNIKNGVGIFGVTGTYQGWTCTGTMSGTRWCDQGDGTVLDMTTGLVWLKKADWGAARYFWYNDQAYANASDIASTLHAGSTNAFLTDGSVTGEWRLPTLLELQAIVTGTDPVSSTNMRVFTGVQATAYWSSTIVEATPSNAYYVRLDTGQTLSNSKANPGRVWPVRRVH
jgi:hypothetical protein